MDSSIEQRLQCAQTDSNVLACEDVDEMLVVRVDADAAVDRET